MDRQSRPAVASTAVTRGRDPPGAGSGGGAATKAAAGVLGVPWFFISAGRRAPGIGKVGVGVGGGGGGGRAEDSRGAGAWGGRIGEREVGAWIKGVEHAREARQSLRRGSVWGDVRESATTPCREHLGQFFNTRWG